MNFWDASALVQLYLRESRVEALESILESDPNCAIWWGTHVEYASAISRREREGDLGPDQSADLFRRFDELVLQGFHEIAPTHRLRSTARRLLRVHSLKAADALQLAAAIQVADNEPSQIGFVCLDARLNEAARREGFPILVNR
ncbi:MAG: type II toxin-antitoxin system VapC family toxin [Gammaproteobacteria bacterium]|nr:type II toxin-antitoxin system VapC family toxin [Gammaproteobacteria bacterium]MYC60636.1 type II toxin-antitoxin system VapC family toxin [Gammaproteobacteria bacterium]MYG96082.1 type II toxin-antitoxin system VapC family toxin [Gammaproteobacteria bacterium]